MYEPIHHTIKEEQNTKIPQPLNNGFYKVPDGGLHVLMFPLFIEQTSMEALLGSKHGTKTLIIPCLRCSYGLLFAQDSIETNNSIIILSTRLRFTDFRKT